MTAGKPTSRHTTVELRSTDLKRLQSQLESARDVLAEWQTSHAKLVGDWDAPDKHYTATAGVLEGIESMKALERQLFQKQRSGKEHGERQMAEKPRETFLHQFKEALAPVDIAIRRDERRSQIELSHGIKDSEHYHRTIGGSGEVAPAKEHAKHEAVRELDRGDDYEMGL